MFVRPSSIDTGSVKSSNIEIGTYGGDYVEVINTPNSGKFDFLVWGVWQGGSWGDLTQRSGAFVGELGWQPKVTLDVLVKMMVEADLELAEQECTLVRAGHKIFIPKETH